MNSKQLPIFTLILLFAFPFLLTAQQFVLAEGDITNTASDSRSVNFIDLNKDGWEDIYISNGLAAGQADLLYLNDGTGSFTPVTDMEIVQASNPSDGASFVDYNNDGHLDGVVSSWHNAEDLLYLNDGAGNLNYNADAGIVPGSYAETAAFGDYDNDGWLDLYITNSGGDNKNYLYRNTQDGKFERILNHILVNDAKLSRGATWGDFNGDGIQDLFVVNESNAANDLFLGEGGSNYSKVTDGPLVESQRGSMTASFGDIDNDGDFDVFVGNAGYFSVQKNQLFLNSNQGFMSVSEGPVVETNNCTYGSAFADYDNDGDLDLLIANGYCNSNLNNALYANQGDGTFADSSHLLTPNPEVCSFGVAWGDINNDGFLDLVAANCKNNNASSQPNNSLLINQGNDNHWIKIKLEGVQSNRSAIGSIVRVKAEINGQPTWQIREVRSQSGYAGQNSLTAHFGLGGATEVDSIIIDWPSGLQQTLQNQAVDQQLNIAEDFSNATISHEEDSFKFDFFPNPLRQGTEAVTVTYPANLETDSLQFELLDATGKVLRRFKYARGENDYSQVLPLAEIPLPAGVYFLVLRAGETSATAQLVME